MEVGRSSRYSSLGGSALGVELKLFGEDRNDLFGIILDSSRPSLGSDQPLYIELGRVDGDLGEFSLWSMSGIRIPGYPTDGKIQHHVRSLKPHHRGPVKPTCQRH
jgi:hypothetical protein